MFGILELLGDLLDLGVQQANLWNNSEPRHREGYEPTQDRPRESKTASQENGRKNSETGSTGISDFYLDQSQTTHVMGLSLAESVQFSGVDLEPMG